jgi:hypothetical protein
MARTNVKNKKSKSKSGVWFIRTRGSYLPSSWQGWLLYIPFISYLIFADYAGWQLKHNLSEWILFTIPNWIAAVIIMTWIAKQRS